MSPPSSDGLPLRFPFQMDGVSILGCIADFRRSYIADAINTDTSSLPVLSHLQPLSASWRILRTCIRARPGGYLARDLRPEEQFILKWIRCLPLELTT